MDAHTLRYLKLNLPGLLAQTLAHIPGRLQYNADYARRLRDQVAARQADGLKPTANNEKPPQRLV